LTQIVITRHPALLDLLIERGIVDRDTPVLTHASPAEVEGKHVIGVLPLHLAVHAVTVTEIPLALKPEMRGRELTLDELRPLAGKAVTYAVVKVNPSDDARTFPNGEELGRHLGTLLARKLAEGRRGRHFQLGQ
jgi:putative CRISPR-associated protein (TIGR02620 family)